MKRRLETRDGNEQPRWLARWMVARLNTEQEPPSERGANMRIKTLIAHLQTLAKAQREAPWGKRVAECEEVVEASMRRYKVRLGFMAVVDGIAAYRMPVNFGIREAEMLKAIERLVEADLFDRLTTCAECRVKWIYRWREDQQYCSEECRQKRYEGTQKRKDRRREYMRDYYREQLSSRGKKHGKR
jgi:hypothetical protein